MKKTLTLLLAVLMTVSVCVSPVVLTGCVTQSTVAPGSDPVVVALEQTYQIAFALADGFLEWEAANRVLAGPQVTAFADDLREKFPPIYLDFKLKVRQYKRDHASVALPALELARLGLENLMLQIRLYAPDKVEQAAVKAAAASVE